MYSTLTNCVILSLPGTRSRLSRGEVWRKKARWDGSTQGQNCSLQPVHSGWKWQQSRELLWCQCTSCFTRSRFPGLRSRPLRLCRPSSYRDTDCSMQRARFSHLHQSLRQVNSTHLFPSEIAKKAALILSNLQSSASEVAHATLMSTRTYAPSPSTFAEDPDRYRTNGLHPLIIGDVLRDGNYKIVHKLGSGSFATVWLAKDTSENRYVSLKILSAETPLDCKELQILEAITAATVVHKGRDFTIQLLDQFIIDGPNGKHWCLVTKVAGDRLARKPGLPYNSLEWPRIISLQVAEALGFLHTLGLAHGGEYSVFGCWYEF